MHADVSFIRLYKALVSLALADAEPALLPTASMLINKCFQLELIPRRYASNSLLLFGYCEYGTSIVARAECCCLLQV